MKILILGKNTLFFFIDDIRKLSIIKKGTYLNTAYMGLMSCHYPIIEEIMKRDI